MPLEKKLINVPLSAGLGQKADIRGLAPLQAATMSNCVRLKNGAIRKRAGMASLTNSWVGGAGGSGTLSFSVAGGAFRGTSWMTDQRHIYQWSDATSEWWQQWIVSQAVALDRIQCVGQIQNVIDVDWCYANSTAWIAYSVFNPNTNTTNIFLTVLDVSGRISASGGGPLDQTISGAVLVPPVQQSSGAGIAPRLVACGSTIVLTYVDVSGNLIGKNYSATAPAGTATTTATLVAAAGLSSGTQGGAYDLAPIVGDATRFLIAYCSNTPTATLQTVTTSSLAVGTARTPGTIGINATSVACYGNNGAKLWATWGVISASKRNLYAGFYDEGSSTLSTTSTAFYTDTATGIPMGKMGLGSTGALCIWSTGYANGTTGMQSGMTQYAAFTPSGATYTAGTVSIAYNMQLASKPINDAMSGFPYVALYTPSALQGTTYLCELPNASTGGATAIPIATVAPRLQKQLAQPMTSGGSWTLPNLSSLPTIQTLGGALGGTLPVQAMPVPYAVSTFHTAVALQPFDVYSTPGHASAELGGLLGFAAGVPSFYDGQIAGELGFCAYPEPTATDVTGGGSLSAGQYQYIVTYEWYDAAGNVHRSGTSPTQTITAASSDSATIKIPGTLTRRYLLGVAASISPLYAIVWRTTAGGSTFYRQTADPAPQGNSFLFSSGTITITDTMSDATLTAAATAQLLYTTGGNLDNFNPPSARCFVQHTQRWFLSGGDNPRIVWASKALTDGEAPGFNEQLAFLATGSVRALASLDDKLIIGVQRGAQYGLEYITGQGPLDTGAQSDWTPPLPIPTNVGPIDQRGTCVGDFGMLFRSPVGGPNGTGGIFLLTRDLQVQYVGGPVEDLLAASPIVTSMVVHPNNGRVYITIVPNDEFTNATTASRLVWDYVNGGVWSSDSIWDTDAGSEPLAIRHGWVAPANAVAGTPQANTYWCMGAQGRVYRENDLGSGAGAFMDSGSQWVTMTYKSAPMKPDLDGFARFWRVQLQADSLETHDFTMQLLYDYAPSSYYQESHTWAATAASSFDRFPQVDVEMLCGNQKAKAIQVVLTDATPTGGGATTGQGPSWSTISVELGVKPGRYPNLPAAQRS